MTNLLFIILISTNTVVESFEATPGQRLEVVRVVQRTVVAGTNEVILSETRRLLVAQPNFTQVSSNLFLATTNWVEAADPPAPPPRVAVPSSQAGPPLPPLSVPPPPLPTNPSSRGRMLPVRRQ